MFEMVTISQLARYICALQSEGRISTAQDSVSLMKNLIKKYSLFWEHLPWPETPRGTRSVVSKGDPDSSPPI